jgi:hypothetical protein
MTIKCEAKQPIYRTVEFVTRTAEPFAVLPLVNHIREEASREKFADVARISCEVSIKLSGFFEDEHDYRCALQAVEQRLRRTWAFDRVNEIAD